MPRDLSVPSRGRGGAWRRGAAAAGRFHVGGRRGGPGGHWQQRRPGQVVARTALCGRVCVVVRGELRFRWNKTFSISLRGAQGKEARGVGWLGHVGSRCRSMCAGALLGAWLSTSLRQRVSG
eukprot:1057551-Rhodomonas_salina.2